MTVKIEFFKSLKVLKKEKEKRLLNKHT